jgi:hypothetical protein
MINEEVKDLQKDHKSTFFNDFKFKIQELKSIFWLQIRYILKSIYSN